MSTAKFLQAAGLACLLSAVTAVAQQTPSAQSGSTGGTSQVQSGKSEKSDKADKAEKAEKKDEKAQTSSEPTTTRIRITVMDPKDHPVPNASVYVRYNVSGGLFHKDHLAEMNFKTNQEGSLKVPEVPRGKVLIQVIAKGWHTYGQWYDMDKDEESVTIKLEAPPHWY